MTFGRHWIAVAAVVPLLVLGACSEDDPEPTFSPPSDSPSATESSPAEPVVKPWEKRTEAGAVAFAKHWMGVFSAAINSGESRELRRLITPECTACTAIVRRIDAIERDGGFYSSPDGWTVLKAVPQRTGARGEVIVALRVRQGAERFRETATSEIVKTPETTETLSVTVEWAGGQWSMTGFEVLT